jgi:acyl-CoA reductase-like NAD-dependent aldehyde dehydrogenase
VGDPDDPQTVIGPVISRKQLDRLLAMLELARSSGARQVLGTAPQGLTLPPHIFDGVTSSMPLAQNEIFGPIAPVIRAKDEADALRIANDVESGLSSAVIGGDIDRGTRFAHRIEAGMTRVNDGALDPGAARAEHLPVLTARRSGPRIGGPGEAFYGRASTASRITAATRSGCDSITTWLERIGTTWAFMRDDISR